MSSRSFSSAPFAAGTPLAICRSPPIRASSCRARCPGDSRRSSWTRSSRSGPTSSSRSSTRPRLKAQKKRPPPWRRRWRRARTSSAPSRRPDGGPFFAREGLLFRSVADVRNDTAQLIKAEPFLATLAADPSLRGVLGAISQSIDGIRHGKTTLEDIEPAIAAIADAIEGVLQGKHPSFSWRRLISGRPPKASELRRFVDIQPVLDYNDLQPGGKATRAIRATIASLGLTPENGVRVRLTGSVPIDDDEFATVADGAALNGAVTIMVVLFILWLALKQVRIIAAVLVNLAVGLVFTAAIGLWMVGALNLISVAFAVLFIGLGVDFGIQFSVRCRAERLETPDLREAIEATARGVAGPLLLAAASIAAAFYSFLPTAYVGLSELGLIAGTGMIIAFVTTVTLLPALLAALKPAGEQAPVGFAALAPIDHFLDRRGAWVVGLTLAAVMLGLPLLKDLRFDFNPLDLRSKQVEFGLHAPRPDARSRHQPQHHRDSGARSRSGDQAGEGAGGSAGSRTGAHARDLRPEGPGRQARPDR